MVASGSDSANAKEKFSLPCKAMITINPKDVSVSTFHSYLLGAVTPRPIALASSVDLEGNVNLSPFSFFNCFGANPPILIFSPSRRVRDNTTKHTYENVLEVPEVVIHIVSFSMVQQVSLASSEYPKNINEFQKAGFQAVRSELVRPPRVAESPVAMECKVRQVIPTGDQGGAGNLIICEVLLMHIREEVMTNGKIDPYKLDAVSRLGGDYYARINGESIFVVPKPLDKPGIGIDRLPEEIRTSTVLTGNDLAKLANLSEIPTVEVRALTHHQDAAKRHREAKALLEQNKISEAWRILLGG
jgi:flavin reductase (DIM6/NTAB) family NADH-FMN oxidoreductase RutF